MAHPFFINLTTLSLLTGLFILILYLWEKHRQHQLPKLEKAIPIFLAALMVPHGCYACFLALDSALTACSSREPIYFMVAGIAILWVALERISTLWDT